MQHMIADLPLGERPRERLVRLGAEALSDRELLAIVIRSGVPGHSALALANELLSAFSGSLSRIATATTAELCQTKGIGPTKAVELCAAFALSNRMLQEQLQSLPKMDSPEAVLLLMQEKFRQLRQEEFHALLLDTRMRLIRDEVITIGLLDRSLVHAREVFRRAIRESCSCIIICHNHPSGDVSPSAEDIKATKMLREAGDIIGIKIIDHVIISGQRRDNGQRGYFSFREERLMQANSKSNE